MTTQKITERAAKHAQHIEANKAADKFLSDPLNLFAFSNPRDSFVMGYAACAATRKADYHEELVIDVCEFAARYAKWKHRNQVRKYTGEPYFNHCQEVAFKVAEVCKDKAVIAAAYLHDTIEDTETTADEIKLLFGPRIAKLVLEVTDVSRPENGNRALRKALDREHIGRASDDGQLIKLADMLSNTKSIVACDPNFAVKYLQEKVEVMKLINSSLPLYAECGRAINYQNR